MPTSPSPSPSPSLLSGPSGEAPGSTPLPGSSADGASSSPSAPASPPSFTSKMLSQAQGRFDAVEKVAKQLGRIRSGLDTLRDLGDSVTSDDVLDEMADLVAHGADPKTLAAMIAGHSNAGVGPMPPGGQPLEGWLANIETNLIAPAEGQIRPALALARHQLGVAAVHRMVEAGAGGAGAGAQPNPLGGGGAAPPPPTAPGSPLLQ